MVALIKDAVSQKRERGFLLQIRRSPSRITRLNDQERALWAGASLGTDGGF